MNASQVASTDPLDRARLRIVLVTIGINMAAVVLLALTNWRDSRTGLVLDLINNAVFVGFIVSKRDALLLRFMIFGVAIGIAELAADSWFVSHEHNAGYYIGIDSPMSMGSWWWIQSKWQVAAVQFGYVGLRLHERFGVCGLLLNGVLAGIFTPFYVWWAAVPYLGTLAGYRAIFGVPYYAFLSLFGIAVGFGWLARHLLRGGMTRALLAAVAACAVTYVCDAVAFWAIEGKEYFPASLPAERWGYPHFKNQ